MVESAVAQEDVRVEPFGLGFRVVFPGQRVRLTVTKLRRGSSGLTGYVEVEYSRPRADGGGKLLLAGEKLNLGSGRERSAFVNRITKRHEGVDWPNVVDSVCIEVQRRDDEGEPVVLIGNLPRPIDGGWLVGDFLERNQAHSLFGDGSVGKSWLALAMAVAVVTGVEIVPGYRPYRRGGVLYVDYETDHDTLNERVKQICRGAGIDAPDIPYLRLDQPFSDCLERVLQVCQEYSVELVIVDSVEAAMAGSVDHGAPANEGPSRMNQALRRLRRTALLVDHINAEQAKNRGLAGKAYGSIFKRNWVRLSYELKRVQETSGAERHLGLFCTKRNNGPEFAPVGLRWEINEEVSTWTREAVDEGFGEALRSHERIAAHLRAHGDTVVNDLAEALSLPRGTVSAALKRQSALFERLPGGLWHLRDEEEELPWEA